MRWDNHLQTLRNLVGAQHLNSTRLRPLLDLLATEAAPQEVLRMVAHVRTLTRWHTSSVNSKYGNALDALRDAATRGLTLHRRGSFHHHLHVGAENELGGTTVVLLDANKAPEEIEYGDPIARTTRQTEVANIPFLQLVVEGAAGGRNAHSGFKAMIEHITGPIPIKDGAFTASRESLKILLETLNELGRLGVTQRAVTVGQQTFTVYKLREVLEKYNNKLKLRGGALLDFQLNEVRHGQNQELKWYVACNSRAATTQLNFEMPLRRMLSNEFRDLFDRNTAPYKVFNAGAARATATAATLTADANDRELLAGLLMLYYFTICVTAYQHRYNSFFRARARNQGIDLAIPENEARLEKISDHEAKNQYQLLPKTPANDVIRTGLAAAQKAALLHHTTNAARWATLRTRLQTDVTAIYAASYSVRYQQAAEGENDFNFNARHDAVFKPTANGRYVHEAADRYGDAIAPDCSRNCFRPRGHPGAHGDEHMLLHECAFTGTGKPVPVQVHRVEEGQAQVQEPVLIFEDRRNQSVLSKLVKPDATDPTIQAGTAAIEGARRLA